EQPQPPGVCDVHDHAAVAPGVAPNRPVLPGCAGVMGDYLLAPGLDPGDGDPCLAVGADQRCACWAQVVLVGPESRYDKGRADADVPGAGPAPARASGRS